MPSFDTDIEKATNENNTTEDWGLILDICDKVGAVPNGTRDCAKTIRKRLQHRNTSVVLQSLTLLDACISNCGAKFHQEIASSDFVGVLRTLITKAPPKISEKTRVVLKKWAENDFAKSASLSLIPQLYKELKSDGYDFPQSGAGPSGGGYSAPSVAPSATPRTKEEDDVAKAIALSLQDAEKPKQTTSGGLYPSTEPISNLYTKIEPQLKSEFRKVRAVYDFEAVEENELTFASGEIITVTDDTDANWWRGYTDTGEGLFPANFVTADLNAEPERKSEKAVSFQETVEVIKVEPKEPEVVEINEPIIDKTIETLQNADPTTEKEHDSEELLHLERQVEAMAPLIDKELEQIDKEDVELSDVNGSMLNAFKMYHQLMQEDPAFQQQQQQQQPLPQVSQQQNVAYGAAMPPAPQL